MTIRRIVPNIVSAQPDLCRAFYSDFLGLRVAMDMGWIATYVSLDNPTAQVSILRGEGPPTDERAVSLSVEVADVDVLHREAVARGYPILYPLTDEPWGVRRFHVADPNGVAVNVMSHGPAPALAVPPELRSPRLWLRRLREGDAAVLVAYRSLPEVARYQGWESFGPEDAAALITSQERTPVGEAGSWLQLGLILAQTEELIGDCGIHFSKDDSRQVELGITLSPQYQGRGLAAEALTSVLAWAFESLQKHRVHAVTDDQNTAAAKLFRRLGFRQEAHWIEHAWYKGSWSSELGFAMLRREWMERAGASVGTGLLR